ncbi:MAG: hypothetical protein IKT44_01465, partial [Clostridia bacterium]|nr:hypothetical protein [Clostridia bacterium]
DNYEKIDKEVAKIAVKTILPDIEDSTIKEGLSSISLPGRFEKIQHIQKYTDVPFILFDVAHTENSIRSVVERMKREKISGILLFGCAADKNVKAMAEIIVESHLFDEIFITKPGDFKKSNIEKMEKAFRSAGGIYIANPNYQTFIPEVLDYANTNKKPIVVLGSFYLAGEVKKILNSFK